MKRYTVIYLLLAICIPRTAYADILEVKGEGFVNGKIVSENDREVTFKNSAGQVRVLKRSDILFVEKEDENIFKKDFKFDSTNIQRLYYKTLRMFEQLWEKLRRFTDKLTKQLIQTASKPLDRSRVNARVASLP